MYDFFFLLSKAMLNQMAESSFDDKRSDAILFFFFTISEMLWKHW